MQINDQSKEALKKAQKEQIKDIRESTVTPRKAITAVCLAYIILFCYSIKEVWITTPHCLAYLPFIFFFCLAFSGVLNGTAFTKALLLKSTFITFLISAIQHFSIAIYLIAGHLKESSHHNQYDYNQAFTISGFLLTISVVGLFTMKEEKDNP